MLAHRDPLRSDMPALIREWRARLAEDDPRAAPEAERGVAA